MAVVNPQILKWARTQADLSLSDAAKRIKLREARGKTGAERLAEMEAGTVVPTRKQLEEMANGYRQPLINFYLQEPPVPSERGQDFRTLAYPDHSKNAHLEILIRDIKASQEIVRDLLEDEESPMLNFIGSASIHQPPVEVAQMIVKAIHFDVKKFRSLHPPQKAFEYLRGQVHNLGVFVILSHNLGSTHTDIPLETFRGFAIADDTAPFIVINDADAQSALAFTLLHELVHLWLGTTGISGELFAPTNHPIEKFCNQVAGLILLDDQELEEIGIFSSEEDLNEKIGKFAQDRNISRSMVAYRLFERHILDERTWRVLVQKFQQEWHASKRRRKEKADGGPNYYVVKRSKLGRELTRLVNRGLQSGSLTPSKASIVLLGVKPSNVHELISDIPSVGTT